MRLHILEHKTEMRPKNSISLFYYLDSERQNSYLEVSSGNLLLQIPHILLIICINNYQVSSILGLLSCII